MGRILAIDMGEKRIGLAISDLMQIIAQPFRTIPFNGINDLIKKLTDIIHTENVEKIIVGIPYTMKGTSSRKTGEILSVYEKLCERLSVSVEKMDERLTTRMAQSSLQEMGLKKEKSRQKVDQLAAVFILQSYLAGKNKKF